MADGPRTCVDRGGTFTDVVTLWPDGRAEVRKVPSDRAVVGELAQGPLCFGTTVATNALLERRGVRTLLVVSEGFADLPHIGDMARPALFDPDARWPAPLCDAVIEVGGRLDAQGRELEPLTLPAIDTSGYDAVAIALINSHRDPRHERAVAQALARDGLYLALGHQVSPELGYLARVETTLVDAAITPVLGAAMRRDRIPAGALAVRSDGSLCPAEQLVAPDAVLSGPAGGVVAVAAVAAQAGFARAVGLDMGGTSTDVCRVEVGRLPRREGEVRVAGVRLRRPTLEVETIAAGGGSILSFDGLRYAVGPASAGADPGPACYGRGGPPTLTDAALLCGLVDPDAFDPPLDPARVELPGPAERFLDIAREAMAQAVRRIATARGVDLTDHALVAYGGAAGQHAAEVAARLGIRAVLVHPAASVLSAWGQALARREERGVRAIWAPLSEAWPAVDAAWTALSAELPDLGEALRTVELRFRGTDHALEIEAADAQEAHEHFLLEHRRRYGFDRDGIIEVVNARLRVRGPAPAPPRMETDPWGLGADVVEGPRVLRSPTTSVLVPAGWTARLDRGLLRLDQQGEAVDRVRSAARSPYGLEIWGRRFMAVAEQAGEVLRRLARSVNIRERLDFSCAVFDTRGGLVANAPHIPVHLGAMGETVRDLLARVPDPAVLAPPQGQAWLCNDPAAGGSHLPDLTVITPVRLGDALVFVGSRGHHVDVGGLTPGSMPPHSRSLADEGLVFRHLPLLEGGRLRDLGPALAGSRDPETVQADLEAQVAANHHAARRLAELGPPALLLAWMAHLEDHAEEALAAALETWTPGEARDVIDGVPLRMALAVRDGRLQVDLTGTGGPHPGNLNAPPAVLRAAVLYGLRCLTGRGLPLNDGALRRVDLRVPAPSILAPPPGAAVVGGNVETSQRLVDLFFRAARARAAGQGTMNNLTLGGAGWSFYETIGGGDGASARGRGASGRQVHMTNTRATDVEVVEARLPLRVRRFAIRAGSGGAGFHRGGDGLVREIELLAPATVALLAGRRGQGAPGLAGGAAGAPGRDQLRVDGRWVPWDGAARDLVAGDRVRVETPGGGGWGTTPPRPGSP
ncbi:MAG: hydantoinase B/oxoprolinase family protein [Alphaproteobacteria bacterium]|nr:hydantoinase B/oxoprolinase family protein [Alphaproteobacteria bacterium]